MIPRLHIVKNKVIISLPLNEGECKVYIIGITGPSGSGKSTIAKNLAQTLGTGTGSLMLDMYYRNTPHLTLKERWQLNYDAPSAYDYDMLFDDLAALRAGNKIELKEYSFKEYEGKPTNIFMESPEILIIDGLHLFYDDRVRSMIDLKVYVQVDADICILRRMCRDMVQRGRTMDSIINQYIKTVKPMYEMYVKGYAAKADMVLPNTDETANPAQIIANYVSNLSRTATV